MSIATEITRLQNAKADIKSAIESKGVTVGDGLIDTYAEKINAIPSGGGGDDYYNTFWDIYQDYGNRTYYGAAFGSANSAHSGGGDAWTDENFYPKYDITGVDVSNMFCRSKITNIEERLKDCGVSWIDNTTSLYYTFAYANTSHIPDLSKTAKTNLQHAFRNNPRLVSIGGLRVDPDCTYNYCFTYCTELEHVIFYGTIGTALSFQYSSKLDKESITSIVSILSTSVSGKTLTLSKAAVNKAFETSEGANDGSTSDEWNTLVASKSNWTVSLS